MKFKKIEYKNYRCFLNGSVDFSQQGNRSLNILIGPNGGGKTEFLFSFKWCLYDMAFEELQGKQNTSYALNSDLYQTLQKSPNGTLKECYVRIIFENDLKTYSIQRKCVFIKDNNTIRQDDTRILSEISENGVYSVPEKDPDEINKILRTIIPESIMSGIIFDGERIQKLSSPEEKSKRAISGVINEITNVSLITKTESHFDALIRNLNKSLKSIPSFEIGDLKKTITRIEELQKSIKQDKNDKNRFEEELDNNISELEDIELQLKDISIIREYTSRRSDAKERLNALEHDFDECYKDLAGYLKDGYLLVSGPLLDKVDSLIVKYDVPSELTANAIKSILEGDKCICGRELDKEARKVLTQLIVMLPPNNINSTLAETIRQTRMRIEDLKNELKKEYKFISGYKDNIDKTKQEITQYTVLIRELAEANSDKDIDTLEERRKSLYERNGALRHLIPSIEARIQENEKEEEILCSRRTELAQTDKNANLITKQISFIEKCNSALKAINDSNKYKALHKINKNMEAAYEMISEDASLGRAIRLIKYDNQKQYNIDSYSKVAVEAQIQEWKRIGDYAEFQLQGLDEDEILEKAILSKAQSDSTGQMKIKTLAFIKAILEYSNQIKAKDSLEIRKEYPLLIDSPFGDIADKNLSKAATALHDYSNQVILMIDGDKYEDLKKYFKDYESNIYHFRKVKDSNHSIIEQGRI